MKHKIPETIEKILQDLYFELSKIELDWKQKRAVEYELHSIILTMLYGLFPKSTAGKENE